MLNGTANGRKEQEIQLAGNVSKYSRFYQHVQIRQNTNHRKVNHYFNILATVLKD